MDVGRACSLPETNILFPDINAWRATLKSHSETSALTWQLGTGSAAAEAFQSLGEVDRIFVPLAFPDGGIEISKSVPGQASDNLKGF